jgi:type II secretory pathway pseudopilin PulG
MKKIYELVHAGFMSVQSHFFVIASRNKMRRSNLYYKDCRVSRRNVGILAMTDCIIPVRGQMVIEVIVAVSIFAIIAASSVMAIVGSLSTARLAEEESQATFIASEGLEAVKSIRNQAWASLVTGPHGASKASGVWAFLGTADVDPSLKFTRVINIADVGRDANGNIIGSGGTADPETKKITATVSWDFTPTRHNSVVMNLYLTNWQLGKSSTTMPQFCSTYCTGLGYGGGVCRKGKSRCLANGEIPENGGNHLCIQEEGGVCCCQL